MPVAVDVASLVKRMPRVSSPTSALYSLPARPTKREAGVTSVKCLGGSLPLWKAVFCSKHMHRHTTYGSRLLLAMLWCRTLDSSMSSTSTCAKTAVVQQIISKKTESVAVCSTLLLTKMAPFNLKQLLSSFPLTPTIMVELQCLHRIDRESIVGHTCNCQHLILVDHLILPASGCQHKFVPGLPLNSLHQRDRPGACCHRAGDAGPGQATLQTMKTECCLVKRV